MRRIHLAVGLGLGVAALAIAHRAEAQTTLQELEARVTRLEQQVRALQQGGTASVVLRLLSDSSGSVNDNLRWGEPACRFPPLIKRFMVICHDNDLKVPEWVVYHLTRADLVGTEPRGENFRPDPDLAPGQRAELKDYKGSGYDRGHMAPAADFKRSAEAMSQSFLLSNVAPQRANLNQRIWKDLEEQVRDLAIAHGNIWVITGPLFENAAGAPAAPATFIGPDRVAVPTHFYKTVLCVHDSSSLEVFAFIMPNALARLPGQPGNYLVSVDSVEAVSGLDFFSALPDTTQARLEAPTAAEWPIQ